MDTNRLPSIIQNLLKSRRKYRLDFMLSKINIMEYMKVIDIGCGKDGRSATDYLPPNWKIMGVDILPPEHVSHHHKNFTYIQRDASDLRIFKDNEFDLAINIGMLEHITENYIFNCIISEIRRIAKQYVIVVPYKYSLIEPHFGIPLFPIIPYWLKLKLITFFNLSNERNIAIQDPDYLKKNYRWLSNKKYQEAFPDAKIYLLKTFDVIAIIKKQNILDHCCPVNDTQ